MILSILTSKTTDTFLTLKMHVIRQICLQRKPTVSDVEVLVKVMLIKKSANSKLTLFLL